MSRRLIPEEHASAFPFRDDLVVTSGGIDLIARENIDEMTQFRSRARFPAVFHFIAVCPPAKLR